MAKVERVSLEDYAREGLVGPEDSMPRSVYVSKNAEKKQRAKKLYASKLSDKEIADFFQPLGYLEHYPISQSDEGESEPFIVVICNDRVVMFNDFTTRVYERPEAEKMRNGYFEELSKRDGMVSKYAEITNTDIGKLIADSIAVDLFGRKFPETYAERKKNFERQNLNSEFLRLPKDLRKFFASAKEIQDARIEAVYNMNRHGNAIVRDEN